MESHYHGHHITVLDDGCMLSGSGTRLKWAAGDYMLQREFIIITFIFPNKNVSVDGPDTRSIGVGGNVDCSHYVHETTKKY